MVLLDVQAEGVIETNGIRPHPRHGPQVIAAIGAPLRLVTGPYHVLARHSSTPARVRCAR